MMVATSLQDVLLASDIDDRAVLVMRGGRLAAVLSQLSAMHGELAGLWFVEAIFRPPPVKARHLFNSPEEFVSWLEATDA